MQYQKSDISIVAIKFWETRMTVCKIKVEKSNSTQPSQKDSCGGQGILIQISRAIGTPKIYESRKSIQSNPQ